MSDILLPALIAGVLLLFLSSPVRYANAVSEGISLWAVNVLPSTFPFLFFTALLSEQKIFSRIVGAMSPVFGKVFRISGAGGCAMLLSMVSGYPVGARTMSDFYTRRLLDENEQTRLSCLCTTSGPIFLIGVVGGTMYQSYRAGIVLYLSHILAVAVVGFFLRFTGKSACVCTALPRRNDGSSDRLWSAIVSVLCVGGWIALYNLLGQMAADLHLFDLPVLLLPDGVGKPVSDFLRGLLEMTVGCHLLSAEHTPLSLACSCFLVTFGGLCVLTQQISFLKATKVKLPLFLLGKCVQAILAFFICLLLITLIGF